MEEPTAKTRRQDVRATLIHNNCVRGPSKMTSRVDENEKRGSCEDADLGTILVAIPRE